MKDANIGTGNRGGKLDLKKSPGKREKENISKLRNISVKS